MSAPSRPAARAARDRAARCAPRPPGTRRGCRGSPCVAPVAKAAIVIASTIANGSPSRSDAVLERAGLGLVGVAHEVVRLGRLGGDRGPLAAGREGGAAAAHELRGGDLGDDRLRADLERPRQGRVAAVGAVVVEGRRIDDADAAEQAARPSRPACGPVGATRSAIPAAGLERGRRRRRHRPGARPTATRRLAGARDQRRRARGRTGRGTGAQPRPAVPGRLAGRPDRPLEVRADRLRAGEPAGDVVADVGDDRRPRLRREQRVERGHAVRLGRRHGQAPRDVVEGRLADPADPRLDGVECRQELRSRRARIAWPPRADVPVDAPVRRGPPTQPVSGGPSTASTAARSAGEASGPMTCRSIAAECSAGSAGEVARVA